jgi:Chlamydia polymorphic membrane protein (Chlamydia_PMP) repeat
VRSRREATLTGPASPRRGNAATEGGGIHNDALGTLAVRDSIFLGNSASDSGGGTYNAATASVRDSILTGNSAASDGGGIFNDASGTLKLRDGVVWHNLAPLGGDLYNAGLVSLFDSIIGHRYDI